MDTAAEEQHILDDDKDIKTLARHVEKLEAEKKKLSRDIELSTVDLQVLIEDNRTLSNEMMTQERVSARQSLNKLTLSMISTNEALFDLLVSSHKGVRVVDNNLGELFDSCINQFFEDISNEDT
jgi:seryl-tRNA synthetase